MGRLLATFVFVSPLLFLLELLLENMQLKGKREI